MKTTSNFKNLALGLSFAFTAVLAQAQTGKVWVTINQAQNVPTLANGVLSSANASFNQAIQSLNITSVQKAMPAARSTKLQNVFEVTCNCNEVDLYSSLVNNVNAVSAVEYAPAYLTLDTPNDYTTSFTSDYALDLINAQGAWNLTHGNPNFIIAISDQNFYNTHEELAGKVTYYDATNTATRTHGTAVAILAAGNTNNGIGKSAIGFDSKLGLYRMNYNDMLVASYAGAKVINLSWTSGCTFNQYAQDAINEAYNNGSFLVASAGNGTTCGGADNLVYPAAYTNVFSVTSVGPYNNHERTIGNSATTHQHNNTVDLSAPGYDVAISSASGWYLTNSGTSFAAPQVTGTIALMFAVNPCLSQANIEYILKASSFNIDNINPLYAGKLGAGRLDAAAAVLMAQNWSSISVTATTSVSCEPNSGQIQLNVNGTAPFTAVWDNGQTGLALDNLAGGTYQVTITDAAGCSTDTTISVANVTPVVFDATVTNVTCNGLANGAIDLAITQGAVQSIVWDLNNVTTEDVTNLAAGNFRVTLTDSNGCISYGSFTVTQPEAITAYITTTQADANTTAVLDLQVIGGTPEYTFDWSNAINTEDQTNVAAGFYTVTVTDANGCTATTDATVEQYIAVDTTTNNGGGNNGGGNNGTAGVEENTSIDLNIYPNPASENATISWNNEVSTLQIINAQGQVIAQENVANTNTFQVTDLATGSYFVQLSYNNNTTTKKLIIQ
jgi:subtilisin family serine protease